MLRLGAKFKRFLKLNPFREGIDEEILEGQTSAGKTTVGMCLKLILLVSLSPKKLHLICGNTIGKVESNILIKDNGALQLAREYGYKLDYFPNGHGQVKMPHLVVYGDTEEENKIIYCVGYSDESKWKDILGSQYGIVGVDEGNIANINFLRELAMRRDYWMITLNPDDPNLEIYSEIINRSRPLKEFESDYPDELLSQIHSQPAKRGSVHWYFTMDDNAALTEEKKMQIRSSLKEGSKQYKNKILGLRGRSEGLVFDKFERKDKVVALQDFKFLPNESVFRIFCGLDSGINADATALVTSLITTAGRKIIIPSFYYKPKEGTNASSQQALLIQRWLDHWLDYFGCFVPQLTLIIGDSAALTQALMLEMNLSTHYNSIPVGKKDIATDITRAIGTMEREDLIIINAGDIDPTTMQKRGEMDMLVIEVENKVWDRKKGNVPEDGNDHCIDAFKYLTWYLYYGGVI